jgi:hypothetical protein
MSLVEFKKAFLRTTQSFRKSLPILLGVLMLFALANSLIPKNFYSKLFTGNQVIDPFIGAVVGSLPGGNPLTSYVIAGELRIRGVSMLAITAFVVIWVTVGIIQLPAEALMLGKRFALVRNSISFVTAIGIAVLAVLTLGWL